MPITPMPSEVEALDRSGSLLRFAAENKSVPSEVAAAICAAWNARQTNQWDENIATKFWLAFNALCILIKPVTIDTLSTNLREIPAPRWKVWIKDRKALSLSRRSAGRYLYLLIGLLVCAVLFGFIAATETKLSVDIEKLLLAGTELNEKVYSEAAELSLEMGERKLAEAKPDFRKSIAVIQTQLQQQYYLLDQIYQKADLMSWVGHFGARHYPYELGNLGFVTDLDEVREVVHKFYETRRDITSELLKTSIRSDVITSSLLPLLLGFMGACAYVLRTISDQIKESTFSTTSPIRHLVRVALGGLAGVVIGFGGIVSTSALSASALAFLAGYAVEPVFATLDKLAEKFK
jgi:hypothetical protein